jgi:uncharacterized protein (DUF934 family)
MPLIREGEVIADPWFHAGDDDPLPDGRPVAVPLARWRREREGLLARGTPLGVCLASEELAPEIGDDARLLALIVVGFASFRDGRPYSTARLLRERYGFRGELRARGDVLRDQLLFMQRCGFDAFDIDGDDAAAAWRRATTEISHVYQPAADLRLPLPMLRHLRRAAE